MTGITRREAARVIAGFFHTDTTNTGGVYSTYAIRDGMGRLWKCTFDGSIRCQDGSHSNNDQDYSLELVSPILRYEDIETLQDIIRLLRRAGAKVNDSCGIHVHIDASKHTPQTLRNIVNIMAAKEDLLYKTLKVKVQRERYCKKSDTGFLDRLNRSRPQSTEQIRRLWYDGRDGSCIHYHDSRYHGLNLHSVFSKGTIEFRLFNSTLHAGEIKSYIQLCLAISHQALVQKGASRMRTESSNEKYTFRTWLLHLGMIGNEFKTARKHLLKNLEGNIAWKDPAQAEAQRQRLLESHRQEREEGCLEPEDMAEYHEDPSAIQSISM
jgi:hypothetical protein